MNTEETRIDRLKEKIVKEVSKILKFGAPGKNISEKVQSVTSMTQEEFSRFSKLRKESRAEEARLYNESIARNLRKIS